MTLHPDEQAREFRIALSKELPVLTPYGEEIFDKALAALLARVRLAEAEWWAESDGRIGRRSLTNMELERIASLRQAAGERTE